MFLESKHIVCEFVTNIFNEEWKSDFIFPIDIIEMLSELNKKLRGNGLFAHKMYVFVKSFNAKLSLFSRQASDNMFPHFPMLKQSNISRVFAAKYKLQIDNLADEFEKRFKCFKSLEIHFNVLSSHFSVDLYLTQKIYSLSWLTCK
ncbi:General transcription factor II-I repeat domain-containing protein 2 [Cucumispora dikerogammari]|nr:General transcription factor II-I repeat domain-containing protein 2 [Cucumispora dikerogammari]